MTIWQISAGDSGRDYSYVFLRYGLIAVGPGRAGPWPNDVYAPGSWAYTEWLSDFCEEMQPGDLVVLKRPVQGLAWQMSAVGEVVGDYDWAPILADVEGWDLQHVRRVRWRAPTEESTVTRGYVRRTLARVNDPDTQDHARRLWKTGEDQTPVDLPEEVPELNLDEVVDTLVEHGLPVSRAERVISTIGRITRLARWYDNHSADVGEHEIRTFLIVPLLLALGWPEQQTKIEFRKIDVALFDRPYSSGDQPVTVIESKRLHDGLGTGVAAQAAAYAASYASVSSLVVSDGFRYKLSERDAGGWTDVAYANLLNLRDRHPLNEEVKGARDLFVALLPG
jgi:hypothetical protein